MDPYEKGAMRRLVRRVEAQEKLLVAYRTNSQPSEKTFRELEATRDAVAEAKLLVGIKP